MNRLVSVLYVYWVWVDFVIKFLRSEDVARKSSNRDMEDSGVTTRRPPPHEANVTEVVTNMRLPVRRHAIVNRLVIFRTQDDNVGYF